MRAASQRPLHRAVGMLAAAGLAVTGLGAIGAGPAMAAPTNAPASPGSPTSGDTLFPEVGNTGYNVSKYDIKLSYARPSGSIDATTTITARTTKRLSSFSLDLEKLAVSRVRVDGKVAAYTHVGHKLVITPARPVEGRFTVSVRYGGVPQTHIDPDGAPDGWIPTADGATVVSEPVGAMTWFPNNNTPRDKATFRVAVKVPRDLEVAGSGDLAGRKRQGSQTTWTWVQTKPQATYLAMISIAQYKMYSSSMTSITGKKLPIWSFIEPKLGSLAEQRALIPKVIRFQERRFGRYPFTSAGIVVKDLDIGYALETQNRPVFDMESEDSPLEPPSTATIVHEFAHQWYGNSVTPRDWGDIWLNEGFASFAESWYAAAHGGPSTAKTFRDTYDANPPDSDLWRPAPAALEDPADLFADPVYTRGGLTLEALRQTVGASDFWKIMKRWATDERYGTVTTGDFIALSERVSGEELSEFFDAWLYVAEKPALP